MVVARGRRAGRMGTWRLMGIEFQFGRVKKLWAWMVELAVLQWQPT